MSRHAPQLMSGRNLINSICDQNLEDQYTDFFSEKGDPIGQVYDQFFVAVWPDCCVTMQHLSDATVHGPYESESEAKSHHEGVEDE